MCCLCVCICVYAWVHVQLLADLKKNKKSVVNMVKVKLTDIGFSVYYIQNIINRDQNMFYYFSTCYLLFSTCCLSYLLKEPGVSIHF